VRFGAVGATGCVVNLAVFAVCVHSAGIDYRDSAVTAWVVSVLNNFLLNRHWTFGAKRAHPLLQGARFFTVSAAVFGFTYVMLVVLVGTVGLAKVPAQAVTIAAGTPLNFLGQKHWSFKSRPAGSARASTTPRDPVASGVHPIAEHVPRP
jgi:putative flippase GtrA